MRKFIVDTCQKILDPANASNLMQTHLGYGSLNLTVSNQALFGNIFHVENREGVVVDDCTKEETRLLKESLKAARAAAKVRAKIKSHLA